MSKPVLIGITGGTGSGKTTVANTIIEELGDDNISMIQQDSYYKNQDHLDFEERKNTNYDHPFAFDTDLLLEHLKQLLAGESINKPVYSFKRHTRTDKIIPVKSKEVIILEGILILENEAIRDLLDIKVYVDTDNDVRFIRRLLRDIEERERTMNSVVNQYLDVVRPMHQQFVEPTKKYADVIIPEGGYNKVAVDLLVTKIKTLIKELNSDD
ncbi:uridine kinase [Halobacteroides halobius DSM 5150]|uniref:Uridine kinase n=1 Tax=Halobacteroides halobius (strain ATCC 35273 / DSM 5150 / MD-1) TaxID=748449 RepID=L0KAB8_HALHC|nr:uridine kinase [Halobacteroides halobius]AGB41951.1 uridine kinase [Halobacteroides halobius DSM 5150]